MSLLTRPIPRLVVAALMLTACESPPPDLEHALELFREGRINYARQELGEYIRLYAYREDTEAARQHVHLIRKIKAREADAVRRWQQGDLEGARRAIGIIRYLHPNYVDSSGLARLLEFTPPAPVLRLPFAAEISPVWDPADTALAGLIPPTVTLLDIQQEVIIRLARRWELLKHQRADSLKDRFSSWFSTGKIALLLQGMDSAYQALQATDTDSSILGRVMAGQMGDFHRFITYLKSPPDPSPALYEYEFHRARGDLLRRVLALKARFSQYPDRSG